jgi:hypothetical protein
MTNDKRKVSRRDFSTYMRVLDELTGKVLGTIVDISTGGFKVEAEQPIPVNAELQLRIDHTSEVSSKPHIVFTGRVRYCHKDKLYPNLFDIGFQIVKITPADSGIFVQMFNYYGEKTAAHQRKDSDDFWS